jgi:hypothetical protein
MFQSSRGADHACAILSVDKLSIFYDPYEAGRVVKLEAVEYKKGSRLFIHGDEYSL